MWLPVSMNFKPRRIDAGGDTRVQRVTRRVVYLVRHGEAGGAEPGAVLTDAGRRQAALLAERLAQIPFATIHHSPWDRAAQTAEIIAGHHPGVTLRASDLLRECVPSRPPDERLTAQQAAWFADWTPDILADSAAQAAEAVRRFAGTGGDGEHELLVTHGNVVNWFVSQALDAPDWAWLRMLDYNAALTVILYLPDRVKLVAYNDTGHLPPDLRGTGYPREARV